MSAILNAIAAEWLREDARAAREHDPDVGVFRNEEMAEMFDHLANEVEAGESQAQRILALEAALRPFVRVNSSEETITIKVRTAHITAARALLRDRQEENHDA